MELMRDLSRLMARSLMFLWFLVFALCDDVKGTAQCMCMPEHPQQQFCRSSFVVRGRIIGKVAHSDRDNGRTTMDVAPVDIDEGTTAYVVKVERIYKGEGVMGLQRHVEVMMMRRDKECALKRLRKGHVYIFTGNHDETGLYNIGTCDWVIEYSDLTKMQKQGVRYLYRQYCNTCEINLCFSGSCKQRSPTSCMWDVARIGYGDNHCEAKHSRCIRLGNGNCGWFNSFGFKGCYRNRALSQHNRVK
ncbi:metalloproteinase inhibitor 3-like isoform X1 [Strongylocentrotus purpuratus]|uniref:NTR domain-containing protein n=1 Tax=Strongylocentrotus purpuratus TaxID=7668 RepID=A0A7M7GPD0_STRPU|nr:metalloproteinase inhibitor 3 isoform X1 [Strongylocentrotus purpuratus]XP_030828744.1 metalloproteinase inhibitor 3-like isoform X1 [Strongylocentrotus purpuratus]|eukprot:XP_003725523.1 PREDICTED: metalloproteinase inhibitor 3 isoform X1 [Strongylocentrotus purpuratus]